MQKGDQFISPFVWALENGSENICRAMLKDLLIIRADRAKYYYGAEDAGGGGGFDHWGRRVAHDKDIYQKCVEMLSFYFFGGGGLKMIEQIKQPFGEYDGRIFMGKAAWVS